MVNNRIGKGKSLVCFLESYTVIDIETTGLGFTSDIIELSAIKIVNGKEEKHFSSLVQPKPFFAQLKNDITPQFHFVDDIITSLTGITDEMLKNADPLEIVLPKFADFISNDILLGHNIASFDSNMLYDKYKICGLSTFSNNYIDTLRLSRKLLPELESHSLIYVADHYGIIPTSSHRAYSDCETTYKCFEALKNTAILKYGNIDNFVNQYIKQIKSHSLGNYNNKIKSKNIHTDITEFDTTNPLYNKVVVFTGSLERMVRHEAMQLVKDLGGENGDTVTKKTNYLVLGNNDFCKTIKDGKSSKHKKAETLKLKGYDIDIISEDVFYAMLEHDDNTNN